MRSIKTHFAFLLPLFFICFAAQLCMVISAATKDYEGKLNKDYNFVLVSAKPLSLEVFKNINEVRGLEELQKEVVLEQLKDDLSSKSLKLLQERLPYFYSLSFISLMDEKEAKLMKERLEKTTALIRIETFSRTSQKLHNLLVFIKFLSFIFMGLVILLSLLLFIKQTSIWIMEHKERMQVMDLHGASFALKASFLYKLISITSVINYFLLLLIFKSFNLMPFLINKLSDYDIAIPPMNYSTSLLIISIGALILSICALNIVMLRTRA